MLDQSNLLKDLLQIEREIREIHSQGLIATKELWLLKDKKLELSKYMTSYWIIDWLIKLLEDWFITLNNIDKWN